jgi:hypothetical protein
VCTGFNRHNIGPSEGLLMVDATNQVTTIFPGYSKILVSPNIEVPQKFRDSVVSIANGNELGDRWIGVRVQVESRIFSTSFAPSLGSTQPHIQWAPGGFYPEVKRQERESDRSPPASAEDKKTWIYTSTPAFVFMA